MTKKSTKKARLCKKCGKPIEGAAAWVHTGEHSMSGPYHESCKPK